MMKTTNYLILIINRSSNQIYEQNEDESEYFEQTDQL